MKLKNKCSKTNKSKRRERERERERDMRDMRVT
jgi:hypothetical protein